MDYVRYVFELGGERKVPVDTNDNRSLGMTAWDQVTIKPSSDLRLSSNNSIVPQSGSGHKDFISSS